MMALHGVAGPNFFDEGSPYLQHPLLTESRTLQEVEFLVKTLGLTRPARLLDVGCGFGRHSVMLAQRGHTVVGIDPAPAMIAAAQARAATAGVTVDLQVADGRTFRASRPFAAVLCLFTTLGQFTQAGANTAMLTNLYDLTRPAGFLVIDIPQRDVAVQMLKPSERFERADGHTQVTRVFDGADQTVTEYFYVVGPRGAASYRLRYRLFCRQELVELVDQASFRVEAAFADYAGAPLTDDSPTMIFVCRR